jgi:hypothetical protein
LITSTLTGHNFFNPILFLTNFSAPNMPIRRVQVLFKHKKQWNPPLGSSLPWVFKFYSCNSITINEQLKDLTHMFCLRIPYYKLYKEGLFYYVFTLKYMCHFGMNWKTFNLKAKHKIKKKIHGYFLGHLILCFPTYLPPR